VLYDVRPGATYEYRVATTCRPGFPVYGPTKHITVPPLTTQNPKCGVMTPVDISNKERLMELSPGDMFFSGNFPTYVIQVTGNNGVFNGDGYTIMSPMFGRAKLRVKLIDVVVNTDYKKISGKIKSVYDPKNSQIANLDDIFEGGSAYGKVKQGTTSTDIDVDFNISPNSVFTFNPEDNTITVDAGGQQNTIDVSEIAAERKAAGEEVFPLTIKDKDGNIYKVEKADENSNELTATLTGKEGNPIPENAVDYKKLDVRKAVVRFEQAGKYIFDEWIPQYKNALLIVDKYEQLHEDYYVPFKLLPPGKTDIVRAVIDIKEQGVDPRQVLFKTPKGTEFKYEYNQNDNSYTITLTGGESGDGQEIYALYPGGKGYYNLGKLIVVSYPERTYNLVAVSVNGSTVDVKALENKLNAIYNPAGISWNVVSDTYDYSGDTQLMEKGSGLLTAYPNAMKVFHNTYLSERDIDDKTAVMFFFDQYGAGGEKDRNVDGFMPRGQQFGYMFTKGFANENDLYIGAAHELGHGVFLLKHPFDNDYKIPALSTDNLMDYTDGTHIAKWQWDLIHDPGVIVRVFERDKDVERNYKHFYVDVGNYVSVETLKNLNVIEAGNINFLSPSGQLYTLPANNIRLTFTGNWTNSVSKEINDYIINNGGVNAFYLDNKWYYGHISVINDDHIFKGYKDKDGNSPENLAKSEGQVNVLIGLPDDSCQLKLFSASVDAKSENENYKKELEVRNKKSLSTITICEKLTPLKFQEFTEHAGYYCNPKDPSGCMIKLSSGRYLYTTLGAETETLWYEWDRSTESWKQFNPNAQFFKENTLLDYITLSNIFDLYVYAVAEGGHSMLDVVGFIPLAGEIADAVNGVWYLLENEKGEAILCFSSILVPVVGDIAAKGGKWAFKIIKSTKTGSIVIKFSSENIEKAKRFSEAVWQDISKFKVRFFNNSRQLTVFENLVNQILKHLDEQQIGKLMEHLTTIDNAKLLKFITVCEKTSLNVGELVAKVGVDDFAKLIDDFADNTDLLSKLLKDDDLLKAWRLTDSYPVLRKSEDILNATKKLFTNPNFTQSGLTDDLLEQLIRGNRGVGAEELMQILKGYDELATSGARFEDIGKMIAEFNKGDNLAVGERWIQRYIVNNIDEFKGVTIKFEETMKAGENVRRVDVVVGDIKKIFYEFKSVSDVPPQHFAEQFIKDLNLDGLDDLYQIKWIFDGKKISSLDKTKFLDELRKADISDDMIKKWASPLIESPTKQDLLKAINESFDKIFKIK
jgi:hypothetical protein